MHRIQCRILSATLLELRGFIFPHLMPHLWGFLELHQQNCLHKYEQLDVTLGWQGGGLGYGLSHPGFSHLLPRPSLPTSPPSPAFHHPPTHPKMFPFHPPTTLSAPPSSAGCPWLAQTYLFRRSLTNPAHVCALAQPILKEARMCFMVCSQHASPSPFQDCTLLAVDFQLSIFVHKAFSVPILALFIIYLKEV